MKQTTEELQSFESLPESELVQESTLNHKNRNNLFIGLAIVIVLAIVFFVTYFLNQDKTELLGGGKCGDGICDEVEQRNLKLCSQDCMSDDQANNENSDSLNNQKNKEINKTSVKSSFSPSFGVHPSSANSYEYADDLGIDFNREGTYFIWDWIDSGRDGSIKFKNAILPANPDRANSGGSLNYDNEQAELSDNESIEMMRNVCPFRRGGSFNSLTEKTNYQNFIEKLVERYDGDSDLGCTLAYPDCYNAGDNDYPSESLINTLQSNPIKYWQTCNQVNDTCSGDDCKENNDYATKYAEAQRLTYSGVKTACPECEVLIAGDSNWKEYPAVYEALGGEYVDIIDKHFFGGASDYTKIQDEMDYLKNSLEESGFDLSELKFWATEVGTYSGGPIDDRGLPNSQDPPYQSESEQAESLIKRYVVSFGEGIEKVLWAWGIREGFGCDCCIFDYTGLIYDGNKELQTCGANDSYDLGDGIKKLSYHSFKLMTDKIGNFDTVEIIQDSGTYIYKFTNEEINKSIWVAWSDAGSDSLDLSSLGLTSAKVTEAVPDYDNGKAIVDGDVEFSEMFKEFTTTEVVSLGDFPVFIEE